MSTQSQTTTEIDLATMSVEDDVASADFVPDSLTEGLAIPDIGELIAQANEGLKTVDEGVRRFVKEKPAVALVGAIAAGFLIGRLLSR